MPPAPRIETISYGPSRTPGPSMTGAYLTSTNRSERWNRSGRSGRSNRGLASRMRLQESQVERREYQDDSYIHCQPFPEPVSEEQEIDSDDEGDHQRNVECDGCPCSHCHSQIQA